MKQGRTLSEVMAELKRQEDVKRDYISPAASLELQSDGSTLYMNSPQAQITTSTQVISRETLGTTELFHRQMGSALNIPAKYYDLMRREKPELLAENVNTWLGSKDQSYMIRSLDYGAGRVARAFLSDRYRRIDNLQIAMAILPLFMGNDQYEVMSSEVTENRMYIKISFHMKRYEVVPGDWVEFGIIISNSEVGLGAVVVRPFLNRLICTNGCVVNDFGERRHHVGRQAKAMEDSFDLYSDAAIEAEDKAFMLKLQDVAKATLDESRYPTIIGKLQDSTRALIIGKVQDVVELTSKSYGFNQTEQESILDYLIRGGDMSLYGLSNAVTRASQDVESYDRATELESIGWDIVTMEPAKWKEINA